MGGVIFSSLALNVIAIIQIYNVTLQRVTACGLLDNVIERNEKHCMFPKYTR